MRALSALVLLCCLCLVAGGCRSFDDTRGRGTGQAVGDGDGAGRRDTGLPAAPAESEELAIEIPGAAPLVVTRAQVESCGEDGCALGQWIPDSPALWCAKNAQELARIPAADLPHWRLKARRRGGLVLVDSGARDGENELREPVTIAPCE